MSHQITKTIVVGAPPSVVFKALTDPTELVQWMPKQAKMEARIGGEYEFRYYWPAKQLEATARGRIVELIPNKRISYTFVSTREGSGPSPTESIVTWTLEELPNGRTRVHLVHSGITEQISGDADLGWGYYTNQLATYCSRMIATQSVAE